jgi:hypothetical protein
MELDTLVDFETYIASHMKRVQTQGGSVEKIVVLNQLNYEPTDYKTLINNVYQGIDVTEEERYRVWALLYTYHTQHEHA